MHDVCRHLPDPSARCANASGTVPRKALVDAAVELFGRDGYDGMTIADIAAAADIGTRTFFGYFASKEELLFPDMDGRVEAALAAIANREPDERPVEVLLRAPRTCGRRSPTNWTR